MLQEILQKELKKDLDYKPVKNFIPVSEPSITRKEISYVLNAVKSGWVSSLGHFINEFEKKFAEFVGTKYALTTSNGTTALHLALVSLGIKSRDEVIIPDLTFVATANAVTYTGAKPVMVDVEPDTWCIDTECIRKAIRKRTKAIIPVHLYGHPANMDEINKIAREHGLYVIEDAAEAHGAEYKGKRVGSLSDCGVFSFYGNKIITTGEGGMITTDNEVLYEKAKYLRDHAMSKEKRYWHTEIGYNYRITNLQAALGLAQLERIDKLIEKKRQIFSRYREFLKNTERVRLNPEKNWVKNVFWMVCLVLDGDFRISRDELMSKLKVKGIDTRPFFYPISIMPMYRKNNKYSNPVVKSLSQSGLNLPSGVNLREKQIEYICTTIRTILKNT